MTSKIAAGLMLSGLIFFASYGVRYYEKRLDALESDSGTLHAILLESQQKSVQLETIIAIELPAIKYRLEKIDRKLEK